MRSFRAASRLAAALWLTPGPRPRGRLGFIPGTVATVATLFYAAKQIEVVGNQFAKFEKMGFTDRLQKYIVSACWAAYWVFMFFGMTSYAAAVPDDLGWGATVLESSFGLLRFAFFIVSIFVTPTRFRPYAPRVAC